MSKKLKRTRQCFKCPWKKSTDPYEIPNGYQLQRHKDLKKTIAGQDKGFVIPEEMHVMACHESPVGEETYCIGWLHNQLGVGNNILLRLKMRDYDLSGIRLEGRQHKQFEDTLPKKTKELKNVDNYKNHQ